MAGLTILLLMVSNAMWIMSYFDYKQKLEKCQEELEKYKKNENE
jgi:hypothetical protein